MTEIVIKHNGSVPNVDAMEAAIEFAYQNYNSRKGEGYKSTRTVVTNRGFKLEVTESDHLNKDESRCSTIFTVRKLDA